MKPFCSVRKRNRGFTLIEVMVALVVVGIALPAMIIRMQSIMDNTGYMNQKTYAHWLAENKMQEMQIIQLLEGKATKTKKRQDTEEFAGVEWHWKIEILETEVEKMFRMEVSIGLEEDSNLATISGFLYEP